MVEREKIITRVSNTLERYSELKEKSNNDGLDSVSDFYKKALEFYLRALELEGHGYEIVGLDDDGDYIYFNEGVPDKITAGQGEILGDGEEVPWNLTFIESKRQGKNHDG